MKSAIRLGLLTCLILVQSLFAREQELLKQQDVKKIMEKILSAHLDDKQVSAQVIRTSLKNYIDHFDPERIYFLEGEIAPFLNLSDAQINELVGKYKNSDYTNYEKLNLVIQQAILRAREIRKSITASQAQIYQTSFQSIGSSKESLDDDQKPLFPKNKASLENRIRNHFTRFIQGEKRRYGDPYVKRNQGVLTQIYEKQLEDFERQYLYLDATGNALNAPQKDNLFTLHILKALASSLDAHTEFFTPAEAYDLRINLEKNYQGIGVSVKPSLEGVVVSGIVEGGPASKNGIIKINDRFLEIDGKEIKGDDADEATSLLKGPVGSTVNLVLKRGGEEIRLSLKRENIAVHEDRVDYSYETFGNGIVGTITLHSFYQGDNGLSSEQDVRDAILKLEKIGNLRGLVLDLRENTGGYLSQAVKVAGLFITNGVVVISKYSDGEKHYFRDMDGKMAYNGPLIILTSKMTASAAEIVAEALQDYGVAVIVGDVHTYGKGTIQTQTVTQDDGSSPFFKVTVGKYYTVSGKTPQLKGVLADVVVPGKYENQKIGESYLSSTVKADQIEPAYTDPLTDIDPAMKPWYLRYYIPTEQRKIDTWKAIIPSLKTNSNYRITRDKNYQVFLKKLRGEAVEDTSMDEKTRKKGIGKDDLQMAEAVNVLKDMIYLQAHSRTGLTPAEPTANTRSTK